MSGEKKVRITIDLPIQAHERIDRLVAATDAPSKAAVIRKAIELYDQVTSHIAQGYELRIEKEGEEQRIILIL